MEREAVMQSAFLLFFYLLQSFLYEEDKFHSQFQFHFNFKFLFFLSAMNWARRSPAGRPATECCRAVIPSWCMLTSNDVVSYVLFDVWNDVVFDVRFIKWACWLYKQFWLNRLLLIYAEIINIFSISSSGFGFIFLACTHIACTYMHWQSFLPWVVNIGALCVSRGFENAF